MRNNQLLIGVCIAVIAVGGVGAYAALGARGTSSANEASLSRVSSKGAPIALPAGRARDDLERAGYGSVALIGSHGGRSILQISRTNGKPCYGSGKVNAAWPIGRFVCQNGPSPFPSAQHPILDFSLAVASVGDRLPHYEQISGVAADGVATVNVLDEGGDILLKLPVSENSYSADTSSLGAKAVELQAVDASGAVVATLPG